MNPPDDSTLRQPPSDDRIARLRAEMCARWRSGDCVPVEQYLSQYPDLSDDDALVLIFGEVVLRWEGGEAPTPEEYAGRFPKFVDVFPRQFELERMLRDPAKAPEGNATLPEPGSTHAARNIAPPSFEILGELGRGKMGAVLLAEQREPIALRFVKAGLNTASEVDMVSTLTDPRAVRSAFDKTGLSSRYELLDEVGRGGMGVVYRGRHRLLGQPVAIKFHTLSEGVERFLREAQLLASIRSTHVVAVQDFDILPTGQAMLVMNWVAGCDLGKMLGGIAEPFPESRAVSWMLQVCEGMRAAAEQGIVHRDLKPSNILIDEADKAYVADFGLARSGHVDPITLTGGLMGTPHYMAPEQAEDPRTVDTRADIYSYGATFYHVVTGQTPFAGESWFAILLSHKSDPLIAPKSRNPSISTRLNDCLERCLAKSPRDRFQTFSDISTHLQPGAGGAAPWDEAEDAELARHLERYRSRRPIYLGGHADEMPEFDSYHFSQERICTIGFGNLVEQNVDALVSSDDESLSMNGGVSVQLMRAAGGDYEETARRYAPVRPGRAVVTPAGALRARFVMHGVTLGQWGVKWVSPSRDLLNEIMESCFYHADSLGLRSIAFPLLGTGAGQFSRDVCLDTMFRFLSRKLAHGLTTVQEARIVIYAPVPSGRPRGR